MRSTADRGELSAGRHQPKPSTNTYDRSNNLVLRRPVESAQYTSRAFAAACRAAGIRQSMSAVGSSADNAAAESFNATFKRETLQGRRAFTDERDARLTAFRWLHRYNTVRRHSRLRQQSPITYERNARPAPATLAPAA
ncbi:hypothetical protein DLE60_23795 [Micromonospora globispora]|nr:integrase core domain-containing protein [Micromonospora globispora]PWU57799.1 hypothetical protein DLE60_23795 [Micromonospora globispora]